MKILFISRAYPPIVGGIENQNYAISKWLGNFAQVTTIANHGGKKNLPFFIPKAFFQTLREIKDHDAILLGDGVLSALGFFLKFFTKKPVISIVHGLDLTYALPLYQWLWVGFFLKKMNHIIAVSRYTREIAIEHGLSGDKVSIIPNGVEHPADIGIHYVRVDLANYLDTDLEGKRVLTTIGRLTRRKGVAWFAESVLPRLPENFIYIVAGSGAERSNILAAANRAGVTGRIRLLGAVPDEIKMMLHRTADLFVQPNIVVPGDMEGFGISVIEASLAGLPVVVSKIEGLQDAVIDGETGIFVESKDADGFVNAIRNIFSDEETYHAFKLRAAKTTEEHFHWNNIAKLYVKLLESQIK